MSEKLFCQSCGMDMQSADQMGTNADGSSSQKYCTYCYQNGEFTLDLTLDEMIEHNLKFLSEWNEGAGQSFSEEEARKALKAYLPELERWK